MNNAIQSHAFIPVMTSKAIANVAEVERRILELPQIPIRTSHVLHAHIYTRTIVIPAGVVLTGAIIKIPTVLIISGDVEVYRGDSGGVRITGTAVLPASAGRKQVFITHEETTISMSFSTSATTIEQAEAEFTDDVDLLMSRREPEFNTVIITGE